MVERTDRGDHLKLEVSTGQRDSHKGRSLPRVMQLGAIAQNIYKVKNKNNGKEQINGKQNWTDSTNDQ